MSADEDTIPEDHIAFIGPLPGRGRLPSRSRTARMDWLRSGRLCVRGAVGRVIDASLFPVPKRSKDA